MTRKPSSTITFEPVIYEDIENYLRQPGNQGKSVSDIVNKMLWEAIELECTREKIYKDVKTQEEAEKNLIALMSEGCLFEFAKNLDDKTLHRLVFISHTLAKYRDIDIYSDPWNARYLNGKNPLESDSSKYNPSLSDELLRSMIREEIKKIEEKTKNQNNNNNNNNKS